MPYSQFTTIGKVKEAFNSQQWKESDFCRKLSRSHPRQFCKPYQHRKSPF
ncbi:hypothetical protein IQ270_00675 [Microcoleus sp. LEGE 07076]|nr:hypothetical protein [Microcoleus sp. LEGE 07076]MBE9183274.1 hypothetical protein [Microcoleus sp. LEGE 07076]